MSWEVPIMRSKNWSFKLSRPLIRKDFTRFWPVWGSYLAIWLLKFITRKGSFGGFCYYCWGAGLVTLILSLINK